MKFKAVCTRADKLMGGVGKEDWERLERGAAADNPFLLIRAKEDW